MKNLDWLFSLKGEVGNFMESMKGKKPRGFYKYSLSGDLANENTLWGLANAVFAAKIYYIVDLLTPSICEDINSFILRFQGPGGILSDPVIHELSRAARWREALRSRNCTNIFGQANKRAETRQTFAALRCIDGKPARPFAKIPRTPEGIRKYIHGSDWNNPWAASSHISHLFFFLHSNNLFFPGSIENVEELIKVALKELNTYRQKDGSWYQKGADLPTFQKVNSAMKIMTGFEAAGIESFTGAKELIDLCLSTDNIGHACNNFNIVCVLYHCSRQTQHRHDEIVQFCEERLGIYRKYYWPDLGGFSFIERQSNAVFYGARITKGLAEPDIHGTIMFLWGIALISRILGINEKLEFKLPIT